MADICSTWSNIVKWAGIAGMFAGTISMVIDLHQREPNESRETTTRARPGAKKRAIACHSAPAPTTTEQGDSILSAFYPLIEQTLELRRDPSPSIRCVMDASFGELPDNFL